MTWQIDDWRLLDPDELKGRGERCQSLFYLDRLYLDPDKTGRSHLGFFFRGKSKTADRLRAALAPLLGLEQLGWGKSQTGHEVVVFRDGAGREYAGRQPAGWFQLYNRVLTGRVGTLSGRRVVSFWGRGADYDNPHATGPVRLIPPCVQELYLRDAVDDDAVVVWGDGRVCPAGDLLAGAEAAPPPEDRVDPEVVRRTEQARRLHLARGAEKRAIAKSLGVGGGGSERTHPWNRGLRAGGKQAPGGSFWRMTSEGKDAKLESALHGLGDDDGGRAGLRPGGPAAGLPARGRLLA